MAKTVREPTLPLHAIGGSHIGFASPWIVRVRLWLMGLVGKVQGFEFSRLDGVTAKGWVDASGTTYVTRVWLDDHLFDAFGMVPPRLRSNLLGKELERQRQFPTHHNGETK